MKRFTCLITIAVLFVACSPSSRYETVISAYLQKEGKGSPEELKLKILHIEELPPVTVKDSMEILKEKFEKEKTGLLERQSTVLKMAESGLENARRLKMNVSIENYNQTIRKIQFSIDSILSCQWINVYSGSSPDEVLAKVIAVTYSCFVPALNREVEETRLFYLTPDGKSCTGSTTVK